MASSESENVAERRKRRILPQSRLGRTVLGVLSLLGLAFIWTWMERERLAEGFIDEELASLGLPAEYEIVSVGPQQQILRNVVVGDPDAPDFTAEMVMIGIDYRLGAPAIGPIELVRPRLFGTYQDGELSFGSLDPVVSAESDEPPGLPDFRLTLIDGRALIESDYGAIGIKTEGAGQLSDGFVGKVAATAPGLQVFGCSTEGATLYGDVTTDAGELSFSGPVRLRDVVCADGGPRMAQADISTDVTLDSDLAGLEAALGLSAARFDWGQSGMASLAGDFRATWRDGLLIARHDLTGEQLQTPFGSAVRITADGDIRAQDGFETAEWSADIEGEPLDFGNAFSGQLDTARTGAEQTLLEPLLAKLERALERNADGGRLVADVTVRRSGASTSLIVPQARLRATDGDTLAGMSRFAWSSGEDGNGRLSGNIATGGEGMPIITGRMERQGGSGLALRLKLEEYAAGDNSIEVPELLVTQSSSGALQFAGSALASGALPGGEVRGLSIPLTGSWSSASGLALGRGCTQVRFEQLELYALKLGRDALTLCPRAGASLLSYSEELRVAARLPNLDLTGTLADSPFVLTADAVDLGYPSATSARGVDIRIGEEGSALRLFLGELEASLGETIGGRFAGGEAALDIVPLEIAELAGEWAYAEEALAIDNASFLILDREEQDRFQPLTARDASLVLVDNAVLAEAALRQPSSDRVVSNVAVAHDLSSGVGNAQIDVAGLVFDEALQPEDLTIYAQGLVQLAEGTITGSGEIQWNGDDVTSSGSFSTASLDFAAPFGPVQNARGTINFTDLIALTTAPNQVLTLGSINPGIEVLEGQVTYALEEGQLVRLKDATWPFMGGTLQLRPVDLNFAVEEARRYTLEIVGLDAETFVTRMEFSNLTASGTFDGTIPLVFDTDGNGRIEGGLLISRQPGGNVAYVGELQYEDMGAIANFAFDALRSLDYRQMGITMNGNLTGEIITNVQFDGVSQGEGASSNFLTRRIAKLPIRFNVNIRSEFFELTQVLRSLYDATYLRDPCDVSSEAWRSQEFYQRVCRDRPDVNPEDLPFDEATIQAQESENTP